MLEHCVCCQAYAPAWEASEYAEWHVVVASRGECLGVVCASCFVDDELASLAFLGEGHAGGGPLRDDLADRRRAAQRRHVRAQARRAAA